MYMHIGKSHVHSNKNYGILVQVNKPKNIGKSHVHSNKNNGILVQVNKQKNKLYWYYYFNLIQLLDVFNVEIINY
jgi:hypothetical protein